MKLFPSKELRFKLTDSQTETLERLKRRTEITKNLTSQRTSKSFLGTIEGHQFKLISSLRGLGAFCVLSGKIEPERGTVYIEIHKGIRALITVLYFLPFLGMIGSILSEDDMPIPILILLVLGQIAFIRYLFVGGVFRFVSQDSFNRLCDILDVHETEG